MNLREFPNVDNRAIGVWGLHFFRLVVLMDVKTGGTISCFYANIAADQAAHDDARLVPDDLSKPCL